MKYNLLIILLSLLPLGYIFYTSYMPHTHDGIVHLARMGAYYKALSDGHIPVRWASDLNYGYGLPLFNFIYQIPYFISSLFIFLGFGLVASFKLVLSVSYIFSGIFIFMFGKAFFKDIKKALLLTVFYQFAPFRFVELFVRGSIGEIYTYTFFPLVLYGLTLQFKKQSYAYFIVTSFATAFLILSHNALSLSFFTVTVVFCLLFSKKKEVLFRCAMALLAGVLLAAFYWLPAIFEHKYTYGNLFMKDMYKQHFPPIQNFFIPNLFNDQKLQTGGISTQFGLFHEIAILLGILGLFIKNLKSDRKVILFSLLIFFTTLFFMQPVSKIVWERLSTLRQFQFPWRLLGIASFTTSMLSVIFLQFNIFKKNKVFILLLILVIASTIHYWNPPLGFDKIDEKYYWNYPLNTTYFGETDLIWSEGPAKSYPKYPVEIIGGKAKMSNYHKKSGQHTYVVDAQKESQLVDHTQYFPGWKVFINGKTVPIQFQDPHWRGQLTFYVPSGRHAVVVKFTESPVRLIADSISITTFMGLLIWVVIVYKMNTHPAKQIQTWAREKSFDRSRTK